jgi:hypothetical protein
VENVTVDEDLKVLDAKISQLKREYDQFFLGTRPREPVMLAADVRKQIARLSNNPFQNTALKFKFSSACSRFQSLNRLWQESLRKIEQGTYERHRFKADLHQRERTDTVQASEGDPDLGRLFEAYVEARRACGQDVANLSPARLAAVLENQEQALRERYGTHVDVRFRVVVENGRAKLKASRIGG